MNRNRKISAIILALFLAVFSVSAQEKLITPDLILGIKTVTDVQISPDGKKILFHSNRPRSSSDKPGSDYTEVWMMAVDSSTPSRFTYSEKTDRSARWSPDGKTIAFISTRDSSEKAQVYLINADGGEAQCLTSAESFVESFSWSPDGKTIAFIMTDPRSKEQEQQEKEGRDWKVFDSEYKQKRLYAIDIASRKSWVVTKADMSVWEYDWSPDSKQLVIAASRTPKIDDQYMQSRLYLVDQQGSEPKLLTETEGKLESPRWSPDAKVIAWLGATKLSDPQAGSIFVVSTNGGRPENLTPNYEGTATAIEWKDKKIIFGAIERQATVLRKIDLATKKIDPLLTQPIIHSSFSISSNGKIALVANTTQHPNEVWFGELEAGKVARLTRFNPQLEGLKLAEQEVVKWKAYDGLDIEGVLIKPVGYEKGKRYPLLLQYHGGPEAADTNGWYGSYSRWGQMLAARGIAVLLPNYRGSTGRGVAFAEADQGDMMGKEFDDALAGIDHLVKEGIVDAERVGLGGGSYGGYAAGWAATKHSQRFKLAIAWMGGANRVSKVGTADNYKEESLVHWTCDPYDNFDLYWDRSPIKHIKNAQTPTLILHGERDPRVPVSQGQELYTALKWKGVPVEFVVYPREGHGVTERAHQADFMKRIIDWCERYLKK
ncbi:MAG: S9 family peptidase [Blastocatellia bacterium]|nr:S9 family peptidase [Blastocatellia bacterium]